MANIPSVVTLIAATLASVISIGAVLITIFTLPRSTPNTSETSPGPSVQVLTASAVYEGTTPTESGIVKLLSRTQLRKANRTNDLERIMRQRHSGASKETATNDWILVFNEVFNALNNENKFTDTAMQPRRIKVNDVSVSETKYTVKFILAYDKFCDFEICGKSRIDYLKSTLKTVYGIDGNRGIITFKIVETSVDIVKDSSVSMPISEFVDDFYEDTPEEEKDKFPVHEYVDIPITGACIASDLNKQTLETKLNLGPKSKFNDEIGLPIYIEVTKFPGTCQPSAGSGTKQDEICKVNINMVYDHQGELLDFAETKPFISECNNLNCEIAAADSSKGKEYTIGVDQLIKILAKRESITGECTPSEAEN